MQNVQRTETREERRVTREFFTDSNQDSIPSIQSNNVHNFSSNKTTNNSSHDNNFSNQNLGQGWPSLPSVEPFSSSPVNQSSILNQNQNKNQQNWTTTNRTSSNTSTSTNKVFSSDMFDDANNDINNFFTPTPSQSINTNNTNVTNTSSRLQDLQNNTSTNRKTVNSSNTSNTTKTNKTSVFDSVDDERNRVTNNNFSSPYSTRPGSAADSYPGNNPNNTNNTNIGRQTNTDTSKLTLEERLNSKQMKTCKVEDIWKVEDTRYTMLIPVGGQYGPEDVNITMKDKVMQVVVKKEKISQYDGKSLGFEGFGKSFSVPRDANFQGIRSTFTTDGQLKIEVPRNK